MRLSHLLSRRLLGRLSLGLFGLALLAVTLVLGSSGSGPPPRADRGDEMPDLAGVVCYGQVDLEHGLTSLLPLQPGRVAEVLVAENQHVPPGKVLLRLQDDLAQSRVAEARAAREAAQVRLEKARQLTEQHARQVTIQQAVLTAAGHRLDAARKELARLERLREKDLVDAAVVDVAATRVKELVSQEKVERERLDDLRQQDPSLDVRQVEEDVKRIQARLDQAQLALRECQLKAPSAGTVLRVLVGPGDVLGGRSQQPAILFAADGPQVVRAEVEQEFAARVAVGQPALIVDDVGFGENAPSWTGRVDWIAGWYGRRRTVLPDPLALGDVLTAECLVKLDPGQPPLRIGQRVRVLIGAAPSSAADPSRSPRP